MPSCSPVSPVPVCLDAESVLQVLAAVADPRAARGVRHRVGFVLALLLAGHTASGFASLTGAAVWAASAPQRVLRALGGVPDPFTGAVVVPSEATLRRVAGAVDPDVLAAATGAWAQQAHARVLTQHGPGQGQLDAVAIDGKTVRGARNANSRAPHLVAVVTHTTPAVGPLVLAQSQVPAKTNEIPAVRAILERVDLTGKVVTVDALHTQKATATAVIAAGGHYLMSVKANTPTLLAQAQAALAGTNTGFPTTHRARGRGHGRTEERHLRAAPTTGTHVVFPHAAQVFRITRYRGGLDGQRTTKEVVHGITSLPPDTADEATLAALARGHWGIENSTHHVRDVTFGEDTSRTRTRHAPANLATLRNTITTTIRLAGTTKIAAARRYAATNHHATLRLLTGQANQDIARL